MDKRIMKDNISITIGHIHLTVSDLNKSKNFYELLGFHQTSSLPGAVFLASGDYHHHIGLNTWHSKDPQHPQEGQIGLFHFAIRYPDKKSLVQVIKRLIAAKYPIDGGADHDVSEAIYLKDPDGNGVEIYYDLPKDTWKRDGSEINMGVKPLNMDKLLKE